MVNAQILKAHGCSAEAWRKILEVSSKERKPITVPDSLRNRQDEPPPVDSKSGLPSQFITELPVPEYDEDPKIAALRNRIRSRVNGGRDYNMGNWRLLNACDLIWTVPFRQVSPSMLQAAMDKYTNDNKVMGILGAMGFNLEGLLYESSVKDSKSGQPVKALNVPAFVAVMIPLVRAYLTIRKARLFNDRNRRPLLPYDPVTHSKKDNLRAEILTNRVQLMSDQYDFLGAIDQGLHQMLLYPTGGLMFTLEEWHFEDQKKYDEKGKEVDYRVCEGLRYHHPHPGRTFWDLAHPIQTFNSNTGCGFAGYWRVLRYRDIVGNSAFFNIERVAIGNTSWWDTGNWFWNAIYGGCTIAVPQVTLPSGVPDRESWLAENLYYTSTMGDASVVVAEYRERLIPKDEGLGDYDKPIWARFVVAGDGTIIYAAPICYPPVICWRDNGDNKLREDASMALLLTPFQDQLGNLLTQALIAAKQNLCNITMVDEATLDADTIKYLKNLGEMYFRGLNIVTFDSRKVNRMQTSIPQAFHTHRFTQLDLSGVFNCFKLVLDMAERVLQFSSMEVAQAASHQQTAAEIEKISTTTNNMLEYTGHPADKAIAAIASQVYEALMNYGEDEFYSEVPSDHAMTSEELTNLGITQDDDAMPGVKGRVRVKAKKSALSLRSFAMMPAVRNRLNDVEAAKVMSVFLRDLLANPITAMALGPTQAIGMANKIAELSGLPFDEKVRDMTEENQKKQANDMLTQVVDKVIGQIRTETKEGFSRVMTDLSTLAEKVAALYQALGIQPGPNATPNPAPALGGTPGPQPAPMAPAAGGAPVQEAASIPLA